MIVICTQCQAKFRVADEKIGPRGAKVRCSKCQTVFVVRPANAPDAAPASAAPRTSAPTRAGGERPDAAARAAPPPRASPPLDVDLEAAPAPAVAPDPFAAAAPADPFALRVDPFGGTSPAAAAVPAARPDDPFLAAALAGGAAPGVDPFGGGRAASQATPDDPFAPAAFPRSGVAATDLSDLAGTSAPAETRGEPSLPPDLGISLEDRVTPPAFAAPGAAASVDVAGFDPAGPGAFDLAGPGAFDLAGPGAFDPVGPGAFDLAGPGAFAAGAAFGGAGEPLALATDDTPARPPPLPPPLPGAASGIVEPAPATEPPVAVGSIPLPPDPDAPPRAASRPPRAVVPPEAHPPDRIPGRRGSRVRTVAVNAVALAALLVIALAMRVAWRGDGRLDAAALRPSAIVGALRPASADAAPFAAVDVRNGLYEREKAPPVLFVRGTVVARGRAPSVRAVRVAVELVRDGVVVGRGDAPAGAVPTPEELWGAADDGALAAVAARAAARAPRALRAGDAVPFLVALTEYPTDLAGVSVRVALEPRP